MRKLQITQGFENIQTIYDQPNIIWTNECAEFSVNNDGGTGQLTVWKDGVAPEQIFTEAITALETKINQFLLAMQVSDNARIKKAGKAAINYTAKDGREFPISLNNTGILESILKHEQGEQVNYIDIPFSFGSVSASATSNPVALPLTLPQASINFERLIGIFSSAEDFSGLYCVEHQLRNYCLILEELMHEGKISKRTLHDNDLWQVRNFISHAKCDQKDSIRKGVTYRGTLSFIEKNFPEAIIDKSGKKYAQFDRAKNSHINFIWTYRDEAYVWVKKELEKIAILQTKP
jgi:hypothetical protein